MRPHHDIEHRSVKKDHAQIAGTDFMVISMGDAMRYTLSLPDYSREQDHLFSQSEAVENTKSGYLCPKFDLSNQSVYIHTAHDDIILKHMVYFGRSKTGVRSLFRIANVYRWLSPTNLYWANHENSPAKWYTLVDLAAFSGLDKTTHASKWWKILQYKSHDIPWLDLKSK